MTQSSAAWRIINSPAADGATNMAIDEAILEAVRQGQSPPTLRLYSWQPACLSIGRFQRAARSADLDALATLGYGFVRRPTGGRAVLHDHELTYAVVAATSELACAREGDGNCNCDCDSNSSARGGTSTGVLDTYLTLSRGLAAGLARMGIPVELAPRDAGRAHRGSRRDCDCDGGRELARGASAACFDSPSSYELLAAGRKIVGSAQVRRGSTLLQHGSILISMDFTTTEAVMGLSPGSGLELSSRVATAGEFIPGFPVDISPERLLTQLAKAIAAGLTSEVMRNARPGQLTQAELDLASELAVKYRSDEWNLSR
jgi:lipoate-protein ligase A